MPPSTPPDPTPPHSTPSQVLDSLLVLDQALEPDGSLLPLSHAEEIAWGLHWASAACSPAFGVPLGCQFGSKGLQGKRHSMEDRDVAFPHLNATMNLDVEFPEMAFFGERQAFHPRPRSPAPNPPPPHTHTCVCRA